MKRFLRGNTLIVVNIIVIVVVVITSIIDYIKNVKEENILYEKRRKEYPFLLKKDSISGVIKCKEGHRGAVLIELKNKSKFTIESSRNYLVEPPWIDLFLKSNDSIYKKAMNDTLFIQRNDSNYFFLIGKIIDR